MTREEIVRELKGVIVQEEGKTYDTCSANIRAMATDCLSFIQNTIDKPDNQPTIVLKPCWVCGGSVRVELEPTAKGLFWMPVCDTCGAKTKGDLDLHNALRTWNTMMT